MRVVFVGNTLDYSPGFMAALAQRSLEPSDPVTLAAIVCPMRFASKAEALWFSTKRRIGSAVERFPAPLKNRARGMTQGGWSRVQRLAETAGVPLYWPNSINDAPTYQKISSLRADAVIVAGLNQILRKRTLAALPPVFNVHPSPLPEYRGGLPEFWQLDAGATLGGVTLHRIDPGVDTGPIVLQKRFDIAPWFDSNQLIERSVQVGTSLVNEFLDGYAEHMEHATPQQGGSYQPFPSERDRVAPFTRPASAVFNRARAAGWDTPLLAYVSREQWLNTDRTQNLSLTDEPASARVELHLYDPVPFGDYTNGPPGRLTRVGAEGVALTCNPGTIVFRRAEAQTKEREQ
jgi:methionyl-tRNA formyltransferase